MEVAVRTSDYFFFKTDSYLSINNENFTPCIFISCETNLEGSCIYKFAKICM